ncbi:putative FixW protein [Spironucleus salmonicida]|uniref:FixW protein n=1 Tax=Spironucleus salmonicida TaxID=348837 RepID=S5TUU5_9EUKA|nr:hypothetical protein SS50377_19116 [Spironucleus salmonicida]KAH0572335.1 putative FixW protein [Spironucleus salmonicida]|eukprot:EST41399.1 Thioredoxin-like domain-containing protein [Spironucleus salmonicida]
MNEDLIKTLGFIIFASGLLYYANKLRNQTPGKKDKDSPKNNLPPLPSLNLFTYVTKPKPFSSSIPTVLIAFGTNCPPCKAEVPHLANLARTKNINVVSIAQEPKSNIEAFVADHPETKHYAVGSDEFGKMKYLLDYYKIQGVPHAFIFDKDGVIIWNGHPRSMDGIITKTCSQKSEFSGKARKL